MESWPPNRQDLVPPLRERLTPCKHTIVMIQCKLQNQSDPSCSATFRPNRSPQIYLGSTPQFPMVDPLRQFRHDSSCGNFNRGEKCHIWGSEPAPNIVAMAEGKVHTVIPIVILRLDSLTNFGTIHYRDQPNQPTTNYVGIVI